MVVETKHTAIEIARKMRKPRKGTASPTNLNSTDEEGFYNSELTFHGTPRKRKYPKTRKKRDIVNYSTKKYNLNADYIKECQIKLLSFAPLYTQIYTTSYSRNMQSNYVYVDVVAITDNRMYKLSKLVAKIMGYRLVRSSAKFKMPDVIAVPVENDWRDTDFEDMRQPLLEIEEKLIKELSTRMFGHDSGYFWNSQLNLYAYDVVKPKREKTYKVKTPKQTDDNEQKQIVEKSYIVRKPE